MIFNFYSELVHDETPCILWLVNYSIKRKKCTEIKKNFDKKIKLFRTI